ncbi:MAG: hypothetical protein ACREJ3_13705 [Polyangiaceae bacterium]
MTQVTGSSCCVCANADGRGLVDVVLIGGARATLCGSHSLMHQRSPTQARSESQLRQLLRERRDRSDRRDEGDELGATLTAAFSGDRRAAARRLG